MRLRLIPLLVTTALFTVLPAIAADSPEGFYSGVALGDKARDANSFVIELRANKTAHLGSFAMANTSDKAQFEMVWGRWSQKDDMVTVRLQPANLPEKVCTLQQSGSVLNLIMPKGSCTPVTCCPLPAKVFKVEAQK